jgi:hypothetical protein
MRPAAAEIEAIQAQQFPELAPAESFVQLCKFVMT